MTPDNDNNSQPDSGDSGGEGATDDVAGDNLSSEERIIASAIVDLRQNMGISKKEFDEDFGDLELNDQYNQLKRYQKLLNKKSKGKGGKDGRNKPIIPVPNPADNLRPYGTGVVTPDGRKAEWRIDLDVMRLGDKSKTK